MTLWGGRFSQQASARFKAFNDSLAFDFQLAEQDIIGSIAWSNALLQVGVITEVEQQQIEVALNEIKRQILEHPQQVLESQAEDIHSWVEAQLIAAIGSLGKKLHTGRSRNDQVATDLKLWCRQQGVSVLSALTALCQQLLACAKAEQDTILPGYTHLQRAQPVTFAHWCLAYVEMFERDHSRLRDTLKRLDSCPLGSGALAGTAYPIDRDKLAKQLGFARATRNSLDAVSDRDHVVELLSNASLSMLHLSRMAEDLIFYNSGEAGFIELSDTVTSGSSLMPQKKNPDVLELIRGKTGRVCGALQAMMMTVKALPLAYNKDLQEDKEGLFDAMTTWQQCIEMAALCFDGLTINKERTEQAALQGYANATELADYLVAKGIPFRDAHHLVGQLVREAIAQNCTLEALSLSALQKIAPEIEADVYVALDLKTLLAKRNVKGGVAPNQVAQALDCAQERVTEYQHDKLTVRSARLTDLDTLDNMVSYWAKLGENLPRPRTEIVRDIGSFAVACDNERVTACGSLYVYGSGLAEIRSLGVDVGFQHQGHGKAIVKALVKKARSMAIKQVFVLTRVPGFFMRQGFYETSKSNLPEKVMKDCEYCPKLHCCDEIAMIIDV